MSARLYQHLLDISASLAKAGVPPLSPFWKGEAKRFYLHKTAKTFVGMIGRAGDKTRTAVEEAICETIFGDFQIAPGERHFFTHVAENIEEARKSLSILESYLRILRIPFTRSGETIELQTMPRGFKVLACRVGAVSGYRCIGFSCDEIDKWADEGSDPAAEVVASIRAMTATHPNARGRLISSPMAVGSYFHTAWSLGNTDTQITAHAPSWVANPSITEERTRELESDDRIWKREYAAIPSAGSSDALDPEEVQAAIREVKVTSGGRPIVVIDSSSGRNDGFSYAVARYVREGTRPVVQLSKIGAFEGRFAKSMTFDDVMKFIAELAKSVNGWVIGDQYLAYAIESALRSHGVVFLERPWTLPEKVEALATLRRLLREKALVIEPGEQGTAMGREMVSLREVLTAAKTFTVQARRTGRGHSDRAALALLAARAVASGDLWAPTELMAEGTRRERQPYRPIRTAFEDFGGLSGFTERPTHTVVPGSPGGQPRVVSLPSAPSPGRGWGGGGGFGGRGGGDFGF